jgi:hypothetical protein
LSEVELAEAMNVVDEKKKGIGQKLETYGLLILAIVLFAFYMFWLILFFVGSTRIPHQ